MIKGKLKEKLLKFVAFDKEGRITIDAMFEEARADIIKMIDEYEYEEIPYETIKEKIIEWFGSDEDESDR